MKKPIFTFEKNGLGHWVWYKEGATPAENAHSLTDFPDKNKAKKNAKRYGYEPSDSDSEPGEVFDKPEPEVKTEGTETKKAEEQPVKTKETPKK